MRKLLALLLLAGAAYAARKQLLDLLFGREDEFVYSASGQG